MLLVEYSLRDGKGGRARAFKEFKLPRGVVVGVFQGSRGAKKQLDIIVKYQELGKSVRTPQHLHWTIDLLIKKEHEPELTIKFVKYLRAMWDKVKPFGNKQEQRVCKLSLSTPEKLAEFEELNKYGEYSVEFIATVLELIMTQEKTGNAQAFMFGGLLDSIIAGKDIFSVVSSARYNGR